MNPIDKLTALFERFPGIGPRQARRFVHYLLTANPAVRQELAENIKALAAQTNQCKKCYRWYAKDNRRAPSAAEGALLCPICSDSQRDQSILFIVEKDADIDNVERSGFKGLYFCLGGTIPLASEEPTKYIRLNPLLKRIEVESASTQQGVTLLKEVIVGLSATTEGDHTRQILIEKLRTLPIKLSSLGRGLSTGSELEYADPDTIAQALGNRH